MNDSLTKSGAELLVECLESEGIDIVLGVPGEENADVMLALEESSIRFISTRHEQGAAFAAATHGKLTGRPIACLGTLGPGACNLLTSVADADMDRAPLIALTGQASLDRLHKESHQVMDVVSTFRPVTRRASTILTPDAIPEMVTEAVRTATSSRPGAVLLELPEDVAKLKTRARPLGPRSSDPAVASVVAIDRAAERLANATSPVIVAGNGVLRNGASRALRDLARRFSIPVTSTFMGKGAVSLDADEFLYTIGIQERDQIVCALAKSDVVIAVGYDLVELAPQYWVGDETDILHIDTLPASVDHAYQPSVEVIGDIARSLGALGDELASRNVPRFSSEHSGEARRELSTEIRAFADDDTEGTVRPQKMLADLRAALGPDDILLCGVGAHKMWVARHYHSYQPNTCLIPNGFCSMGQPLPGLIGAKLARPDVRCVALCGDGDFLMNVQEMETIARLELDVTAIVWEDHGYGLIEWKQESEFGRSTDLAFGNPDWIRLADAFGWQGEHVKNSRDLAPALDRALDDAGPSLLVVSIDYRENMKLTERLGRLQCPV